MNKTGTSISEEVKLIGSALPRADILHVHDGWSADLGYVLSPFAPSHGDDEQYNQQAKHVKPDTEPVRTGSVFRFVKSGPKLPGIRPVTKKAVRMPTAKLRIRPVPALMLHLCFLPDCIG